MTSPWQPPDPNSTNVPTETTPQYGELAAPGYVSPVPAPPTYADPASYGVPTYGAPSYDAAPTVRKSRPADIAITSVLLALGLIGMLAGLSVGLTLHQSLAAEAAKYGLNYSAPANLGALGAFIAISHVVLFLAALGISLPLLITRRIAFWVPLVAGVVAGIIMWSIVIALLASDQSLMDAIQGSR